MKMFSTKYHKQKWNLNFSHIFLIIAIETVTFCHSTGAIKIKCTNPDDFYFTSPGTQCSSYYRCTSRGQKETLECSRGSKFDFYKQSCSNSPGSCSEPECSNRPNGIFQDITHACMRSFTCYAGQLTSLDNCPLKYLHNGQKCVQQDLVVCDAQPKTPKSSYPVEESAISIANERMCKNKKDGAIHDPTSNDCSSYIICKAGEVESRRHCSNQAVFNGETCVPSPLHQCNVNRPNAELHSLDLCQGKVNGYFGYPQHGCTSYLHCMSERVVEIGVCPSGQYFDMDIRKCVYERILEQRRCFEHGQSSDCEGQTDGFYSDLKCESYYYCHQGNKIEYKCSAGKIFNGRECVPKSEHKCSKVDGERFCHLRPDGYYKDANEGCRAYNYCSNGHKITYLCESGHIFDSRNKKCMRKDILGQQLCPSDHVCYGKSDGYHTDVISNCRNYVYCKNYEKITQLTCRDGKVFNGLQCVTPEEYTCPSLYNHRQANCVPQSCLKRCESDGFYADLSSECREYFFCIGGKSSKLSCPAGKRFNGEICIAEDKFACPVVCTQKQKTQVEKECPLGGHVAA